VGVSAIFLLLRLGPVWQGPVGGAELVHLSGAWQARIGVEDDRFVPTLFQAITAALLHLSDSEVPPRVLALAVTGTIPGALYLLRSRLGDAGALVALLALAFDGPAINMGVSASAMGFDLALMLWLFVGSTRRLPAWTWAPIGFAIATSGPLALPLVASLAIVALIQRQPPSRQSTIFGVAGAAVGVMAATIRFGLGADGLRVPPLALFADGYEQPWSTSTVFEVGVLYSAPVVLGGLAAAAWWLSQALRRRQALRSDLVLLVWAAVALLWFLSSAQSHSAVPVVALTTSLALILGRVLPRAIAAMVDADWEVAAYLLPAAGFAASLALMRIVRWAHAGRVGDAGDKALVAGMVLIAVAALAMVAMNRAARPALLAAVLAISVVPILAGTFGVALSDRGEPIPSPIVSEQARQIRDIAFQQVADHGGVIVADPRFADQLTWAFRDSGSLVLASRVPADATFVIWPLDAPAPEGMSPVDGRWALAQDIEPPGAYWLDYVRWYIDRHSLRVRPASVALYVKGTQ
jgi:hypothetical protein